MDNYDFKGKVTLLRIDVNVRVDGKGKIKDHLRFREHAKTIRELSDKKAKVVVISHQGRPGQGDFIDLRQHAKMLSKHSGKSVAFVPDIIGPKAVKAITGMKQGDVIMLDNIRKHPDENIERTSADHMKSSLIQTLAYYGNIFVLDALSVSHRSHATVVGFYNIIPCVAGRVMQGDLAHLEEIRRHAVPPNIFVLGGGKPEDCLEIMEHMLPKGEMDNVLTCGSLGELFLMVQGHELGKKTVDKHMQNGWLEFYDRTKALHQRYGSKITTPVDLAVSVRGKRKEISLTELPANHMVMDIGSRTYKRYGKEIRNGGTVVHKGPAGMYEEDGFGDGSRMIFKAITETAGHSFVGGGDTIDAMESLKIDAKKFDYVCLGGGALVNYLSGKELPGLKVLYGH